MIIGMIVNSHYYNTNAELVLVLVIMVLLGIQFAGSLLYLIMNYKRHTLFSAALGFGSMVFIILVVLFLFNAVFWSTDTGAFHFH